MFNKLVASGSKRRRFWTPTTVITSVVFHGVLVAGAYAASKGYDPTKKAREELVDYMEIKEEKAEEPKPEEPKPEEPEPPKPEPAAPPPVVKGFQELQPPQDVPKDIAPPTNDVAVNEADFSGQGKAGGVAGGVNDGVAQSTVQRETPPDQGVYDISSVEELPRLTNGPAAARQAQRLYPPLLRDAGVAGTVNVQFVVDGEGRVEESSIQIISTDHEQFNDPARRVAASLRFRPAKVNNQPVRVTVQMPIQFQPQS